jgi:hypothetical protein
MVPDNINNWIPTKHSGVPILERSPIRKTCCLDVEEPEKGAALSSGVWLALGGDRPTRKRRGFWRHLHATSGKVIAPGPLSWRRHLPKLRLYRAGFTMCSDDQTPLRPLPAKKIAPDLVDLKNASDLRAILGCYRYCRPLSGSGIFRPIFSISGLTS